MSYLSTSGNVGYSGIPQNVSDTSCATQYKMAVESGSGACGSEMTVYTNEESPDEQTYIPYVSDFSHTKFKIDPNEIYTFHDSDVIASEITVSHTEDSSMVFHDSLECKANFNEPNETKKPDINNIKLEYDFTDGLSNGEIKEEIKEEVIPNGHYINSKQDITNVKETLVRKILKPPLSKEFTRTNSVNDVRHRQPIYHIKGSSNNSIKIVASTDIKSSINSVNMDHSKSSTPVCKGSETFLDVFKREIVRGTETTSIKTEPNSQPSVPSVPVKSPSIPRKSGSHKPSSATSKSRSRGRGPALHEALQRIPSQRRAIAVPNRSWHAPGSDLFECGPLKNDKYGPFQRLDVSSSDDDDHMPSFGMWMGCAEESGAEERGARLALRRAALRRQVARASAAPADRALRPHRALLHALQKELCTKGPSACMSPSTLNLLLATRGVKSVLSSQERRRLRGNGWSGGESGGSANSKIGQSSQSQTCAEEMCERAPMPCGRHCLAHVTLAPEQRLYAACAAVFAGGARCKQPLLPLHDQTPLCAEHAWKRDNYDKISRECKPKKVIRKRVCPPNPRRAKRRRRPPVKVRTPPAAPTNSHSLSDLNVCSNSSAYDSSEDTGIGGLSENEFIVTADNQHGLVEVGEVGQVPPDDILDPSVLSQIPDEAFTEFFNQSEGGPGFAESEELARALEAVLDERALDSIADCVFTHAAPAAPAAPLAHGKIQVSTSVGVEMSSGAPS